VSVSETDLGHWQSWIGRSETRTQLADAASLRRFAVATGWEGDILLDPPPLAVWAWFLETVSDAEIGPDGHPSRGGFLPPVSLPRRMFAAASLDFHGAILLDAPAEMALRVADVQLKRGESGELVFVDVERTLSQAGIVRVSERQTYVYREAGAALSLPPVVRGASDEGEIWQPDAVNLFRFSAATFNSHRIHYDRSYAREVEHYPDLVVQGPLAVARLTGLAARHGQIAELEFRALAPLFVDQPVRLIEFAGGMFEARRCDGLTATRMKVRYA
jgi:3-methylfumaryl-CoA hydratase